MAPTFRCLVVEKPIKRLRSKHRNKIACVDFVEDEEGAAAELLADVG